MAYKKITKNIIIIYLIREIKKMRGKELYKDIFVFSRWLKYTDIFIKFKINIMTKNQKSLKIHYF